MFIVATLHTFTIFNLPTYILIASHVSYINDKHTFSHMMYVAIFH